MLRFSVLFERENEGWGDRIERRGLGVENVGRSEDYKADSTQC